MLGEKSYKNPLSGEYKLQAAEIRQAFINTF